jgi:hypothetical protein
LTLAGVDETIVSFEPMLNQFWIALHPFKTQSINQQQECGWESYSISPISISFQRH